MNALILAGSRGPDDPLARAAGVRHKTLLPILGIPMLLRVVRALRGLAKIETIYVCIEDPKVIEGIAELDQLRHDRVLEIVPTKESPAASLSGAIEAIDLNRPLLITTGDHPLLTPKILQSFLTEAPLDCDIAVGLASSDVVTKAYPGAVRTFYKLGGQRFNGCNLFLVRSIQARRVADFWQRLERFRKRPLRLIWEIGPLTLLRVAFGWLDLNGAFELISRLTNARIRPVFVTEADAAIDVDKPEDRDLVEEILRRRGEGALSS